MFQVITNSLTVDEGGEGLLSPEHIHVSDVDSVPEALKVELHKEPNHGVLHLSGDPLTAGQTFDLQDLKSLKVRSDILPLFNL